MEGRKPAIAPDPADGTFVTLRVPYLLGFDAKGLDGSIDDPTDDLWRRVSFHMEGGKGTLPKIVHFQIRPNPLAD